MRTIIILLIAAGIAGCRKTPSITIMENSMTESDGRFEEAETTFSFSEASVSEKKGRSDEVYEVLRIAKAAGVLTDNMADSLSRLNDKNLLESNFDIVRHSPKAFVLNTDTFSVPFPLYYNYLIDSILRRSMQSNYMVRVKETTEDMANLKKASIEIILDSHLYHQKVYLDSSLGSLDENFYQIVNQTLSALGHPYRYYLIRKIMEYTHENNYYYGTDNKEYAVIWLDKPTALALHQFSNVINLSVEDHRKSLDGETVKTMLYTLDSASFFPPYTDIAYEHDQLTKKILYDVRDIFFHCLPLRRCFTPFSSHFEQSYQRVVDSLSSLSGVKLQTRFPVGSPVSFTPHETEISIEINNTPYTSTLTNGYDRVNIEGLLQLINTALNKEHMDGNFYLLNNKSVDYCYIFMTGEQVDLVNRLLQK